MLIAIQYMRVLVLMIEGLVVWYTSVAVAVEVPRR